MSASGVKYGLNVKKKGPAAPARRTLLDDEDDGPDDEAPGDAAVEITSFGSSGPSKLKPAPGLINRPKLKNKGEQDSRQDASALLASRKQVKAAEELDSAIFDYDSFHDAKTSVTEAKKAAAKQDAIERKPKYINNLLDAAARRKQDQQVAKEKMLQREREAEGDEFADKEKFVTGAYKEQQEENKRLEEEEKRKVEEEEERKRKTGGGMQGFYKTMMDQSEKQHQEAVEAAAKAEKESVHIKESDQKKTDAEMAAEMRAKGINVQINEEGQIVDKRDLLQGGLNFAPSGKACGTQGAEHLKASNRSAQSAFQPRNNANNQQASRERQSRMMEEQLAAQAKRARDEEEEERARIEKAAKSTKTDKDVSDAKARYLARKAAKERGEG